MIHDAFRPRFLGQVRLGTPESSKPGPDPITFIDPSGRDSFPRPSTALEAPAAGCVFLGYKTDAENKELANNLARAHQYGYTEPHEVELPVCDLPVEASVWEQFQKPWCVTGPNMAQKAVWACPGPDYERLQEEVRAKATQGCEKLFISQGYFLDPPEQQTKIQEELAAGRRLVRVATGNVLNVGTKSEVSEAEIWSCPRFNVAPTPTGPSGAAAAPPQLPLAPVVKPDLVPVAAGAGVVAILAAIIGGAFGGK